MAANNDPNCEWSWMDERHPSTDVTPEDNGPPDEGDDDDLEAGWPMAEAVNAVVWTAMIDAGYKNLCTLRGIEARML